MNRLTGRWMGLAAAVLATGLTTAPLTSAAQEQQAPGACPGCGQRTGRGPRSGGRLFDPKTVTTVQGDIDAVQTREGRRARGVLLTLTVGSEKLQVVVGPSFYVDEQSVKLAQGDKVEVKGSRTTWGGQPVMIAQEIRKGDQVLSLRDSDGVPLWARARARQ